VDLAAILHCPRCRGSLAPRDQGYDCTPCRVHYPALEGIVSFLPGDTRALGEGVPPRQGAARLGSKIV
jgi:uncharacterized protein YbaR (Trm112 family)